jgi:hypothetical protein
VVRRDGLFWVMAILVVGPFPRLAISKSGDEIA